MKALLFAFATALVGSIQGCGRSYSGGTPAENTSGAGGTAGLGGTSSGTSGSSGSGSAQAGAGGEGCYGLYAVPIETTGEWCVESYELEARQVVGCISRLGCSDDYACVRRKSDGALFVGFGTSCFGRVPDEWELCMPRQEDFPLCGELGIGGQGGQGGQAGQASAER